MVICPRVDQHHQPAGHGAGGVSDGHLKTLWNRIRTPGQGRPRPLLELAVIALMFGAYKLGRMVAAKHVGEAFSNAYVVWDLERLLRLPDELSLQALTLRSTAVIKAANVYYAAVHFPATAAFLIWLYLRRPGDYLWLRRTLALLTATGLLVHLAIPVAPPRMLGRLGFVDTADIYGPAVYGPPGPNSLADQYAAMPSLHVGWAILVAIGVITTTRSRGRWLIVVHPVLTALVVVATANHFWLDGLVATGLLATSLVVVRAFSGPRYDVPLPEFVPVLPVPTALPPPAAEVERTLPDRLPPPVRTRRPPDPSGQAGRSGPGAEDLADVAGDRRDR